MTRWYVTQTKARQEGRAQENLESQGYTTYCPRITRLCRRRGAWQKVGEPLFPRYLFMRLEEGEDDFTPIRSTKGVLAMLRFGDKPASISQQAIDSIRHQEQQWQHGELSLKQGDKIQFIKGPFAGLNGIFNKKCNEKRVFILLELLGKENFISVDINNIVQV